MNNYLTYKGFTGTIEASIEDNCLHGQILFIEDIITYEANTVDGIKTSFEEAVDHYLAYCEETGKPANKPYSGTFNVRIGQELHRKAAQEAYQRGIKLNEFVTQSIQAAIDNNSVVHLEHTHTHKVIIADDRTSVIEGTTTEQPLAWETYNAAVN